MHLKFHNQQTARMLYGRINLLPEHISDNFLVLGVNTSWNTV